MTPEALGRRIRSLRRIIVVAAPRLFNTSHKVIKLLENKQTSLVFFFSGFVCAVLLRESFFRCESHRTQ